MAGEPYAAGGIRTTVAATRAATDEQLTAHVARLVAGDAPPGHHHRRDQERLRPHRRTTRRAAWRWPGSSPTRPPSSARTSCPEYADDPAGYVDLVTGPMLEAAAPHARWIDAFCETRRLRRRPGPRGPRGRRGRRAAGGGCTPTSSARARASGSPPSSGLAAVDHCTYLDRRGRRRARATPAPSPRCCPASSSRPGSPTPTPARLLDAGVAVALASDCNPGSCFTSSMPLCIALAVREMGMTPAEAVHAATSGGAAALDRDDVGVLAAGQAGRPGGARRAVARPPGLPAGCRSSPRPGRGSPASPSGWLRAAGASTPMRPMPARA